MFKKCIKILLKGYNYWLVSFWSNVIIEEKINNVEEKLYNWNIFCVYWYIYNIKNINKIIFVII